MGSMVHSMDDKTDLDDEHGLVQPRMLPDPGAPSRQEVLEHELTHLPFRTWCPHCVAARAKSMKHLIDRFKSEGSIPVVGIDYAFMTKTDDVTFDISSLTTLVAKDSLSTYIFGIAVPKKGIDEQENTRTCK